MANTPHLTEYRRDRILVAVYLVVVPLMILTIVLIGAFQTRDARNEAKQTANEARMVAQQTCQHTNQRDRILNRMVHLFVSLTESSGAKLSADQQDMLDQIEAAAGRLRPQDCTP